VREALKLTGTAVDRLVFWAPGSLPRTTSGKHQRSLVAERLRAE
jgi:hypothetical protein